jgi:hypothetical protein
MDDVMADIIHINSRLRKTPAEKPLHQMVMLNIGKQLHPSESFPEFWSGPENSQIVFKEGPRFSLGTITIVKTAPPGVVRVAVQVGFSSEGLSKSAEAIHCFNVTQENGRFFYTPAPENTIISFEDALDALFGKIREVRPNEPRVAQNAVGELHKSLTAAFLG